MATLRARATMTPLDVERWIRTATATLEHGRLLEFTDAGVVHPQTGRAAGWRDLGGDPVRQPVPVSRDPAAWSARSGRFDFAALLASPPTRTGRCRLPSTTPSEQTHALDVRLAATSPDSMGRQLVCQLVDETVVEAAR